MRLLVVDVGNTSTAVGLWTDGRVSSVRHIDEGLDAAKARGAEILARAGRVDALAYVSVVPRVDRAWAAFAKRAGVRFHALSARDFPCRRTARATGGVPRDGIVIDYPRPETIGADRLADAAGAVRRYGAPVLVMDFGTALTAAVVTADRIWRGGVIAPGFPLMRDYFCERTAKLPCLELGRGRVPKIGRSTEEAMRFGALVGCRGMVREITTTLVRNFKTDFRLVATGGFARWVLSGLDLDWTIDPTLTLYGAGLVTAENL